MGYKLRELTLPAGAVVVDIGCAYGLIAMFIARRFPDSRVICVESSIARFRYLVWSLRINGLQDQVETYNIQIGNASKNGAFAFKSSGLGDASLCKKGPLF